MEPTQLKSPFSVPQESEEVFTPLEQFKDKVKHEIDAPYPTRLSFKPLLEKWDHREKEGNKALAPKVVKILTEFEAKLETGEITWNELQDHPDFLEMVPILFPSLFESEGLGFITVPLTKDFAYQSPKFLELMVSGEWDLVGMTMTGERSHYHMVFSMAILILNQYYGQNLDLGFSEIFTIEHKATKLRKHFKVSIVLDFVEVELLKPLKKLRKEEIHEMINDLENIELWLKNLPPDNFSFSGFVPGYTSDVTEMEVLSVMRRKLASHGKSTPDQLVQQVDFIQQHVRSFMADPELWVGCMPMAFELKKEEVDWSLLRLKPGVCSQEAVASFFRKVAAKGEAVIINDLKNKENLDSIEQVYLDMGIRSLLFTPLIDRSGKVIGVFELGSPRPYRFSKLTLLKIREVVGLFSLGVEQQIAKIYNQVQGTILANFTAIHPSVQWKFQEVATKYIFDSQFRNGTATLDPIVFKDLHPCMGRRILWVPPTFGMPQFRKT